ncbi:Asp-tRNA(Asn)/Glu-tRNA(Gln) amidotransferase subunit GatC [bacterium]|nr:Asp-tRNA(Asn)/Glu-tRNA(Gln) amidotransferase subunit GatC [bacterium]
MSIDKNKIKHVSKLARISVDENKIDSLTKDLSSIFKFIEQLNELNTNNIEPLSSILNEPLRLRKDEITDGKIREKILENSPQKNEEFFVVPKVIE